MAKVVAVKLGGRDSWTEVREDESRGVAVTEWDGKLPGTVEQSALDTILTNAN